MRSPATAGFEVVGFKFKKLNSNCSGERNPNRMAKRKTQNSKRETAQNIRQPMHAKVHAQKSPRKRQKHHNPAILRHAKKHSACHRQIVHRMARRKAVLVKRRHLRLNLRIRSKRARTLCAKFHSLVNHEAHHERNKRLPKNRQETIHANFPNQKRNEQSPNVAIAQPHIELEELRRLRRKMAVRPIHGHAIVKFKNFLEHGRECRNFSFSIKLHKSYFKFLSQRRSNSVKRLNRR